MRYFNERFYAPMRLRGQYLLFSPSILVRIQLAVLKPFDAQLHVLFDQTGSGATAYDSI